MEQTSLWYDNIYRTSEKYKAGYEGSLYLPVWKRTLNYIGRKSNVMDMGCGTGQYALFLYKHRPDINYYGIDFSFMAIDLARKRDLPETFYFAWRNVFYSKPEYQFFDVLVMLEFLEHIEDDLKMLMTVPRGMTVVYSVPNHDSESHVRFFENEQAVTERYGSLLANIDSFTYQMPCTGKQSYNNNKIFLFKALKK